MRLSRYYTLLLMLLFASCSGDDFVAEPEGDSEAGMFSISTFIESCLSSEPVTIREDFVIAGCITTSDSTSNFYRTFIVDDGTGAIEIMCGFYDVYTYYKIGYNVRISVEGLTFAQNDYGVCQLGLATSSVYDVEYFGHRAIAEDYISLDFESTRSLPVTEKSISQIDRNDIARTLKISGLKLVVDEDEATACWAPNESSSYISEGTVTFSDDSGRTIDVVTSGYASFAGEAVPTGTVDITGLLFWNSSELDEDCFYLKINDENSVYEHN